MNDNILELVSQVDEFLSMHDMFEDDDLDEALSRLVKLIMKPDVPPQTTARLIIQLQAIASKLYIIASYHKNVSKPKPGEIDYQKKNMYYSIAEALTNLVAALKYNVRGYTG